MGLLDKVKEGAAQAAAAAKDAAQKGQAKLDALQAKRASDALLRDLGATSYAEKSGRAGPDNAADAARIVGKLEHHERDNGEIDLSISA